MTKRLAICLMGLTGTGKTDLAIALSEALSATIISVDSAMVYRGMDIGTAKPSAELLARYPHQLIDIISPKQRYSVANFLQDATRCYQQTSGPCIFVGGTMMYFHALQHGLHRLPPTPAPIRQAISQWCAVHGQAALYQRLIACDPQTAQRLNVNDRQRVQRAVEIYEICGVPLSTLLAESAKQQTSIPFLNLALISDNRVQLRQRLAARFDQMLLQGVVEETQALLDAGVTRQSAAMRSVGYQQIAAYLDGELSRTEMRERAIVATRQLAKRQHTWLRKWQDLHIYQPYQADLFDQVYAQVLQEISNK